MPDGRTPSAAGLGFYDRLSGRFLGWVAKANALPA
jgi:hypothetical protein